MKNLSNFSNDDLQGISEAKLKKCLTDILSVYGSPSFGSMSKRDIDLTVFSVLQELKFIEPEPTIYEVMQKLKVTRSKARNLIYEAEIRKLKDENDLDDKLREKIQHPIFGKIGDKISLEIDNPLLIDHLRYRLKKLGAITDGSFHAEIVSMTHEAFSDLYVELLPQEDANAIYNQFVQLGDAPYGMFCLPYSDKLKVYSNSAETPDFISDKDVNFQVASQLSALLGDGVIKDLQLLPYCPLQQNILTEYSEPSFSSLHVSKSVIKAYPKIGTEDKIVGYIYWCNKSNFDLKIPYTLNINNYKEESELNTYRLCSPGYKSVFEFNAAKNGGIKYFHVDCTYKPYNPFILIHPYFSVLYGKNYEDNRGLICTDDFSLPIISDQWTTYELNNKNYANTFYREIQSAQLENKYAHYNDIANMFSGTVQGTGSGMMSGMLTGGPIGAGIGGTIGGLSSLSAGIADVSINQKLRNDQIDKAETLFKYNLENIKARPQTVSKSSPIVKNNKQVPFLETYSCSNEEKEAFRAKIKHTGMTILKTSTLRSYVNYIDDVTESYVKGSIIRFPKITEDFHYLKELSNEVGKGFYLGSENY